MPPLRHTFSFALAPRMLVGLVLMGILGTVAHGDDKPAMRWVSDPANPPAAVLEISGLPITSLNSEKAFEQWRQMLSVHAVAPPAKLDPAGPSMLGSYRPDLQAKTVRFHPRFPLEPGIKYTAILRLANSSPLTAEFELPHRAHAPTTIAQIYPTSATVPENLLKFYIHFSAPMSGGDVYQHIRLLDDSGKPIVLPFLELGEELWNPEMTRLTLFIDPGRIKRGVAPLEDLGPALEAGKRFTLSIDNAWKDAAGTPLKERFEKPFAVTGPDRTPLDPSQWEVAAPATATREPLAVAFGESIDHALAQRMIHVAGPAGERLDGQVKLDDHERRWTFTPANPWRTGLHQLVIQTTIEDLAGNNVGKPFEVDVFQNVQRHITSPTVALKFDIR